MREVGRPSWRIAVDSAEGLHLVLFIRDALWLDTVGDDLPGPLAFDVPDLSAELDRGERAVARQAWPAWWRASLASYLHYRHTPIDQELGIGVMRWLVEGPGHGTAPPESLQGLARAALEPFRQWWSSPRLGQTPSSRPTPPSGQAPPSGRAPARRPPALGPRMAGVKGELAELTLSARAELDVVRRIEAELGRRAEPFEFDLQVIGVSGPSVLAQEPHRAAVSSELVRSGSAYTDWLYRALRPLA